MEEAIILYSAPLPGHLLPMVELGKLILSHHPSLTIQILSTTAPDGTDLISSYLATVSATIPSITFHNLPTVTLPPSFFSTKGNQKNPLFEVLRLNNPNVHQTLLSISQSYTIHGFVIDFFCFHSVSVASKLNIPVYYFIPCGGSNLASFLYMSTIHRTMNKSFKDLDTHIHIPGLPPTHSRDMPQSLLDRDSQVYKSLIESSALATKAAGIIVNTFETLEARPLKAVSDGLSVPNGSTPPVYCLGPLIADNHQTGGEYDCLKWLDSQPSKSVVFLCFGSMGLFSTVQLKQIADGLERSGQRFLWVVRNPPSEKSHKLAPWAEEDPDLDSLLPEGFQDRTRERGLVVKKWVPQLAVLKHDSVGGFVTHCGWNSVLEAVCSGVPMIAWPLYAEQRSNRVFMVEEMKIALWMHESESGLVTASEIEERVIELIESEKGELVRNRVMVAKREGKAALLQGGSSRLALTKFVQSWKRE
ncbi:hypothetical protein L6164_005965 [Bauhinia variegata]|uniref:Uncharacterized protein n=2 Tax=Bauhinia variegata TaxID=167791 RepID=A0ACB9PT07_BAUVA|nr:hypothetical protein L6164_005965 [Bauhinia variegata]